MDSSVRFVAVAFLVTAAMMFVLRPLAEATGLVDTPNARKRHTGDVPVVGGVAIFLGVFFSAMVGSELSRNVDVILSMAALMCIVGVVDDRFDLKPWVRLLAHLTAAVILVLGTGYTVDSFGAFLGFAEFDLGMLASPFTIVACVALINACNMLDGMDGLAGGAALVAFGAMSIIAMSADLSGAALVSLAMVGAIAGFLLFNLPANFNRRVRTFMGDAGSTVVGFTLAAVALVLVQPDRANLPPVYVLCFVPIPIFELFTSTIRRLLNGHSPLHADNGHFHHRLLNAGFSVRLIFFIYFMTSLAGATLGLLAYHLHVAEWVIFLGFVASFALWLLFVRSSAAIAAVLPRRMRRDLDNLFI